jgi:ABC-2 type transport system permease protein
MTSRSKKLLSITFTILLIVANLAALNYLIGGWTTARLDLTEEDKYTISETTRMTLRSLDEPVTVYGYFSNRTHPKLAPLVPQIEDLLDEYSALSRGKLTWQIIDPGEDEEAEREASQRYGVRSTPFQLTSKYEAGIVNAYFALVIKYGDQYKRYGFQDLIEITPMPDGDVDVRLRNLEYDLTRGIRKVVADFRRNADLFASLEETVRFTAIMTPSNLPEVLQGAVEAVNTAADEMKDKAGDRFQFEIVDPSTDEQIADEVYQRYGARPLQLGLLGDGGQFYLYGILEIGNQAQSIDLTKTELTAADVRESIEDAVRRATPGFVQTIGIASPDPSLPPEVLRQLQMQGQMPQMPPPQFETLRQTLGDTYEVQGVDLDSPSGVAQDIDLLVVLKPSTVSEMAVYNLDQFLMRGGRAIIAAGNYDVEFSRMGLQVTPIVTGLDDWLAHYGITIDKQLVLDDRNQPLPVPEVRQTPFGAVQTWTMAPYPYLVQVEGEGFANRNVAGTLQAMGVYWASPLRVDEDKAAGLEIVPILRTSEVAWTSSDLSGVQTVDYQVPPDTTSYELAVAVDGRFKSYFAGRQPPQPESDEENATPPPVRVTIDESPDTRLVVIANSEFVSDFVARALGGMDGGFFAENVRFVENLIDWTTQDSDMIAIRSRGISSRRLAKTDRTTEITIESINYMLPWMLIVVLAITRYTSRKRAKSMFANLPKVEVPK